MKNVILSLMFATLFAAPLYAQTGAEAERPFLQSVRAAMEAEARTDVERERDANRLPVETLDFFGLNETMTVLELIPGGGWYASGPST